MRLLTLVGWSFFPLVWTVCYLDLVGLWGEELLWALADTFGKVGGWTCGGGRNQSSSVTRVVVCHLVLLLAPLLAGGGAAERPV